jgi:hypothetical protein
MALQSTINISIDFYDKKYIMVNAKQNDKNSRFLLVACYNHGEFYPINADEHSVFVRYRKSDGCGVFNICNITNDKKILVELTEQMLASAGICYADLIVANKGSANLDTDTGEVVAIDNASILSTMTFCIDVSESTVDNADIESSYEFDGFNSAIEKCLAEYSDVIQLAKSWAVGDTDKREGEDTDNAKYYYEQSNNNAQSSASSATSAADSATQAMEHMTNAQIAQTSALASEKNAKAHELAAQTYAGTAKTYRDETIGQINIAKGYKDETLEYKNQAEEYKNLTQTYMNQTGLIRKEVEEHKDSANDAAIRAQSYAVGGTGTREGEDVDNAWYWYRDTELLHDYVAEYMVYIEEYLQRIEALKKTIETAYSEWDRPFIPRGTITYSEFLELVPTNDYAVGYLYNISDSFTTDEMFRVGAGVEYGAGTNVYYAADGSWDCLVSNNVGSVSTTDVASVDEVKDYLGI